MNKRGTKNLNSKKVYSYVLLSLLALSLVLSLTNFVSSAAGDEKVVNGQLYIEQSDGSLKLSANPLTDVASAITDDTKGLGIERLSGWWDYWYSKIDSWDTFGIFMTYIVGAIIIGAFLTSVMGFIMPTKYGWTVPWLGFGLGIGFILVVRPEEMLGVLLSFKSLALSVLSVVPLVILGLFSVSANIKNSVGQIFIGKLLWIVYLIYIGIEIIVYGLIRGIFTTMTWAIIAVNVFVALWFIFTKMDKKIAKLFEKAKTDAAVEGAKRLGKNIKTASKVVKEINAAATEAGSEGPGD